MQANRCDTLSCCVAALTNAQLFFFLSFFFFATDVSIYQSDGHCHDWCFQEQSYALAILNYQTCWCSDLVPDPAVQVPTSECSTPCPGYPSDLCGGGSGSNLLYGYLANPAVRPSGTSPVAAAKPSTTALPQSQPVSRWFLRLVLLNA